MKKPDLEQYTQAWIRAREDKIREIEKTVRRMQQRIEKYIKREMRKLQITS